MKRILYLLIFFAPAVLPAQNYQNICSPGDTYFGSQTHNLKSFRRDSMQLVPSPFPDTIFWSFPTIQNVTGNPPCLDTTFGSILGRKILKRASGDFVFFNKNEDSIYIWSNNPVMQPWKCVNLPDACYLNATITQVYEDTILGVADSVKTIILQAKNAVGQNIPHNFNGKEIHLSKSYGFTLIFDLVRFPDDTAAYRLEGKSSPPIGYQEFSMADCFDFDIGDEFHIETSDPGSVERTIKKVLNKSVSISGDTIVYTWERCSHYCDPGGNSYIHDTITSTIILHNLLFYLDFCRQPFEFNPYSSYVIEGYERNAINYNSRSTKRFHRWKYYKPSCWAENDYYKYYDYSRGLGLTKYYYTYKWETSAGWIWLEFRTLLEYFSKGNETWGTPYATDCETLVKIDTIYKDQSPELNIYPNPVQTVAKISVNFLKPGDRANLVLFDYFGREIFRDLFGSNPYNFSREGIPGGFYILTVSNPTGKTFATGKLVIE